jgi:hypothetical protein
MSMAKRKENPATHIIIPDTQVKPGVDTHHLGWINEYVRENYNTRRNVSLIHLGDHWDMPSLSSYDKGKKKMEGMRVSDDIEAGNQGWRHLTEGLTLDGYYYLRGNHEERIQRAIEADAQLDGVLGYDTLAVDQDRRFQVYEFTEVLHLDGVAYSHYFYNPNTGRPYAGANVEARIRTIGRSFTMGHQQGLLVGMRNVLGRMQRGLVAGSCYLHDEQYLGPQGNVQWRGILVCHQVEDGDYGLMEVSLDYLCRRYEGMRLATYLERYPHGR